MGRVAEAITLYEQTLADSRRVLGNAHQLTRTIATNLQQAVGPSKSSEEAAKASPTGDSTPHEQTVQP